jgi:hypothetical protein
VHDREWEVQYGGAAGNRGRFRKCGSGGVICISHILDFIDIPLL